MSKQVANEWASSQQVNKWPTSEQVANEQASEQRTNNEQVSEEGVNETYQLIRAFQSEQRASE